MANKGISFKKVGVKEKKDCRLITGEKFKVKWRVIFIFYFSFWIKTGSRD